MSGHKLWIVEVPGDPLHKEFAFFCPGCKCHHSFIVKNGLKRQEFLKQHPEIYGEGKEGPEWTFNGDLNSPTFQPSLLYTEHTPEGVVVRRCHLFMTNGRIQYLSDCMHDHADKTIPIPELDS